MPVYEYKCKQCGERIELTERMGSDGNMCESCGGPLVRVWQVGLLRENIRAVPRG